MNIEVTIKTFNKLFGKLDFVNTNEGELASKHFYYREDLDQRGVIVRNYIGNITQFYLTDINA